MKEKHTAFWKNARIAWIILGIFFAILSLFQCFGSLGNDSFGAKMDFCLFVLEALLGATMILFGLMNKKLQDRLESIEEKLPPQEEHDIGL